MRLYSLKVIFNFYQYKYSLESYIRMIKVIQVFSLCNRLSHFSCQYTLESYLLYYYISSIVIILTHKIELIFFLIFH